MIGAICHEAELRNDYITENISTIYFGGGTHPYCRLMIADC
jgi:coproporphyrinogen III oxidase-like Fe-S oxidoreductase